MKIATVTFFMVEKISEGFSTGISRQGLFTDKEIKHGKHNKLIDGIKLIDGCKWSCQIDFDKYEKFQKDYNLRWPHTTFKEDYIDALYYYIGNRGQLKKIEL